MILNRQTRLSGVSDTISSVKSIVDSKKGDIQSLVSTVSDPRAAVRNIKIETKFLPEINIPNPMAKSDKPNPALLAMQPKITIDLAGKPITYSPYGEPGESKFGWIALATGVVVIGLGYFTVKGMLTKW